MWREAFQVLKSLGIMKDMDRSQSLCRTIKGIIQTQFKNDIWHSKPGVLNHGKQNNKFVYISPLSRLFLINGFIG